MAESTLEIDLLRALGNRVLVGASARDWVEAVRLAGELLVRDGVVEERYVEAYEREARMIREAIGRVAAYDVPLAPEVL